MNARHLTPLFAAISLIAGGLACERLTGSSEETQPQGDSTTVIQELTAPLPTRSPLNKAAEDLSSLQSFEADLRILTEGTSAGQPFNRQYKLHYLQAADPLMTILTIDSGSDESLTSDLYIKKNGAVVGMFASQSGCFLISPEQADEVFFPPGSLLPEISSAQPDGQDTLAGTPVDRFTISNSETGLEGQVLQAANGGPVLQFTAEQNGPLPMYGSEAKGQATWEYTLTVTDQPLIPDLPAACRHLLGEVPLPPQAQELTGWDEFLTFTTDMPLAELAGFYRSALETDGWELTASETLTDSMAVLHYSRGETDVTINARSGETRTMVTIFFD